jgi:mRNA-degrading endonuclease toxin of MazEF toxin-antitoxin module
VTIMALPLDQGRIVWVELLDPQGRNPKIRPAVIVTQTEEITDDGVVVVVSISTQIDTAPEDVCVELPWHRDGHPRTKLNSRNVAICTWAVPVQISSIVSMGGRVPMKQMREILSILLRLNCQSSSQPIPVPPT